jgi:spore coat protein U-like protein
MRMNHTTLAALALVLAFPSGTVLAAGSHTVTVGAVVTSNHNCRFNTATSTLAFGNIDPSSAVNATATVTIGYRCTGGGPTAFWSITSDDGLHETGVNAPRMRHTVNPAEFLPYTLNVPAAGSAPRNVNQTFTLNGTITPSQFAAARAGGYSDTVVLSITP